MRFLPSLQRISTTLYRKRIYVGATVVFGILFIVGAYILKCDADNRYQALLSPVVYDRNNLPMSVRGNTKEHYAYELKTLPDSFIELLTEKEDRYFFMHPGINPASTLRALIERLFGISTTGASTLTQQLAKNILGNESERTVRNKLREAFYALSMELFLGKKDIVIRYANTVYLGNQVQGFETGSQAYFGKSFKDTTANEQLLLLATLSHPSTRNPWEDTDAKYAKALHERLLPDETFVIPNITKRYDFQSTTAFELSSTGIHCDVTCKTSIDSTMTADLRAILKRHVDLGRSFGVTNGAVVVIDVKTNELRTIIGSVDPTSDINGGKINMAIEPRPIGSTIKPFIYLKGFMEGLRPYTLVDDREYRFPIATGYSLYPKNYDGKYHGIMTLHEALSNSLNVPTVKVLEYIGLTKFYEFLDTTLAFTPIQPYDSYQYGIALGGLETDLLTLTHYFTIFPSGGLLSPLRVGNIDVKSSTTPPHSRIASPVRVADTKYVELVHAILSDRLTGVEQFGLKSNLNLSTTEYGVKTGTSRDFHDSWVVGYTPDVVVGVWIGNSENTALDQVSGQSGAGAIWHDVMEYLLGNEYERKESFNLAHAELLSIDGGSEWGLREDRVENHQNRLLKPRLITSIHDGDTFERTPSTVILLGGETELIWSIDGVELTRAKETTFAPTRSGKYEIGATDPVSEDHESITIYVTLPLSP